MRQTAKRLSANRLSVAACAAVIGRSAVIAAFFDGRPQLTLMPVLSHARMITVVDKAGGQSPEKKPAAADVRPKARAARIASSQAT